MKKILITHSAVGRSPEACIEAVAQYLVHHGFDVSILAEYDSRTGGKPMSEICDGVQITRCYNWEREWFNGLYKTSLAQRHNVFFPLKFWLNLIWWVSKIMFAITIRVFRNNKAILFADNIEQFYLRQKFDILLAVTAPFHSLCAAARFKHNHPEVKFVCYMLDPYTSNIVFKNTPGAIAKRAKDESLALAEAAAIIATPEAVNTEKDLVSYPNRVEALPVPLLKPITFSRSAAPLLANNSGRKKIFFGGSLTFFRNIDFIVQMLQVESLRDFELHIAGSGDLSLIGKYSSILGDRLIYHGFVDHNLCYEAMHDADILLHIGNNTPTQIPGKLLEYMATGKPMLHVYYIDDDGCLPYLEKYRLNIAMKVDTPVEDAARELLGFYDRIKGTRLTFEEVSERCREFTAEHVLERIAALMKTL